MTNWSESPFFLGLAKAGVGLPVEHPLDVLKTRMQSQLAVARGSVRSELRATLGAHGAGGLYHGLGFNAVRSLLKNTYRTTAYLHVSRWLDARLPAHSAFSNALITAPAMAASEALLLSAPERLKIWVITAQRQQSVWSHLRSFSGVRPLVRELYRGAGASFLKGLSAWLVWDVTSKVSRQEYRRRRAGGASAPLLLSEQLGLAFFTSGVTVALIQPVDFVKSRLQQFRSQHSSVLQVVRGTPLRLFYIGASLNFFKYALHDVLISVFREWTTERHD